MRSGRHWRILMGTDRRGWALADAGKVWRTLTGSEWLWRTRASANYRSWVLPGSDEHCRVLMG
jgi:hypothetical protein